MDPLVVCLAPILIQSRRHLQGNPAWTKLVWDATETATTVSSLRDMFLSIMSMTTVYESATNVTEPRNKLPSFLQSHAQLYQQGKHFAGGMAPMLRGRQAGPPCLGGGTLAGLPP